MAILGIDEVGRGPLAGPLVVGAVILPEEKPAWVAELRDSKRLTERRRERLEKIILKEASATGLGWVSAGEIDRLGMIEALKLATKRAVKSVQRLHVPFSQIIIDGDINFLAGTRLEKYTSTVVKGDDLISEVSAASIIAKQARDRYMREIAQEHPGYGFERHVGYGTELHRKMMKEKGLCSEHRRLVKPVRRIAIREGEDLSGVWTKEPKKNTTAVGMQGEEAVCEFLERQGHTVMMRNFKTKFCEIDIVSTYEGKVYFTEVKYRKSNVAGGGLAAIDQRKLQKMEFAAKWFLRLYAKECAKLDPVLAVAEVTGEDYEVRDWLPV